VPHQRDKQQINSKSTADQKDPEHANETSAPTAAALATILISAAPSAAQTRTTLDIYVIDVEGGNATLFVTPSGESV